jgi:hypothetical protein
LGLSWCSGHPRNAAALREERSELRIGAPAHFEREQAARIAVGHVDLDDSGTLAERGDDAILRRRSGAR